MSQKTCTGMGIAMIERFLRWLAGYLHICLYGSASERFLNLCNSNDILLWNIGTRHGKVECFIGLKEYKTLRPIVRKCRVQPRIQKRYGFPFLVQHIKKRKILAASIVIFLSSIWLMSKFLWNISFEGEYRHTEEQLLSFLKEQGIYAGCATESISCPDLEAELRKEYPDIGWVSVELKGTRLFVRLKETTQPAAAKEELATSLSAASIVAQKDGIIETMVVRNGTPCVSIGDVVKKGDVLVSGVIHIYGDDEAEVNRYGVVADADITMSTYMKYKDKFAMKYIKKHYTGREKSGLAFSVLDHKIFSYNSGNFYEECDIISEVKQLRLSESFYLPFLFEVRTLREYESVELTYTEEEAKELAAKRLLRYLEEQKAEGIQFVSQETTVRIENGYCITEGILKTKEDAWTYQEIRSEELALGELQETLE